MSEATPPEETPEATPEARPEAPPEEPTEATREDLLARIDQLEADVVTSEERLEIETERLSASRNALEARLEAMENYREVRQFAQAVIDATNGCDPVEAHGRTLEICQKTGATA